MSGVLAIRNTLTAKCNTNYPNYFISSKLKSIWTLQRNIKKALREYKRIGNTFLSLVSRYTLVNSLLKTTESLFCNLEVLQYQCWYAHISATDWGTSLDAHVSGVSLQSWLSLVRWLATTYIRFLCFEWCHSFCTLAFHWLRVKNLCMRVHSRIPFFSHLHLFL